jgi:hypothetical protein
LGKKKSVYALGFPIASEVLFMEVDVTFGIYTGLSVVGFELDGAVDVIIIRGFVEVPAVAEDTEGGVSTVYVPLRGVIGV